MSAANRVVKLLPRAWATSFDQLRRDVSMVARGFSGQRTSPLVRRRLAVVPSPLAAEPEVTLASHLAPRALRVTRVVRETKDAVSIHLEDPSGASLAFRPGQFFTVLLTIDGETHRRAYSISSSSLDERVVSITVKRVAGGRVSNHLNDHAAVGQTLQVLGPSGNFTYEAAEADAARHVVLLAGGSGITPMMAIARTLLATEPSARITLVYGNRGAADIIFKAALAELAAAHPERLVVRHVLSDPPEGWTGGKGLLARDVVHGELEALAIPAHATYFVCGPEPMMLEAKAALLARGVAERAIKEERFTNPQLRPARKEGPAGLDPLATSHVLRVVASGVTREINAAPGQTVLEAGLGAGVPMPYSCAMGGCAACKVKLKDGDVEMEEPNCLTREEREDGYVLACVSRLRKPSTVEVAS